MFRACSMLCGLALTVSVFAHQAKDPPYQVPTPKDWGKETIQLPPAFAPDVKWQGAEELRFAPNWMKADSENFFSYALLFWLPASQKTDAKTLASELLSYYRGLSRAVSESKKRDVDVKTFTMTVKEASTQPAKRPGGEDATALVGELKWIEPFTTGKEQTLRMEIQVWQCPHHKSQCVFICASPQPETAVVWKALRAIRDGCTVAP